MNRAEYFFATVIIDIVIVKTLFINLEYLQLMKESLVHVSWPCRLKIGAKTRKGKQW